MPLQNVEGEEKSRKHIGLVHSGSHLLNRVDGLSGTAGCEDKSLIKLKLSFSDFPSLIFMRPTSSITPFVSATTTPIHRSRNLSNISWLVLSMPKSSLRTEDLRQMLLGIFNVSSNCYCLTRLPDTALKLLVLFGCTHLTSIATLCSICAISLKAYTTSQLQQPRRWNGSEHCV